MVSATEAMHSLGSESHSFSSPSSSLLEQSEEEKGGDAVSLSTCSMSTNPTPDNPLYSARSVVVSKSMKVHKTVVSDNTASSTVADLDDTINDTNSVMDGIIQTTRKMVLNDQDSTEVFTKPHYAKSNSGDCPSLLSGNVVSSTGLHEEYNKSPEPALETQIQQIDHRKDIYDDDNKGFVDANKKGKDIKKITPTTYIDVKRTDEIIQSSPNSPSSMFSIGAGSPIGASLLLRDTNDTSTDMCKKTAYTNNLSTTRTTSSQNNTNHSSTLFFVPQYICTKIAYAISRLIFDDANDDFAVATWLGFWAYLNVSCANLILKPIMDAVVLELGVENQPKLILASSVLAFLSSVPIGWLFEAPDPKRRKVFKKMGMTRGETQGTSLALFYRFFALSAISYAVGFQLVDIEWIFGTKNDSGGHGDQETFHEMITFLLKKWGQFIYIAFFLVIHLMKLHSTSLVWGVTTEAMEYEEIARKQHENSLSHHANLRNNDIDNSIKPKKEKTRLQRLARIQFGGTLGSIWGSTLTSSLAQILHLPGLLVVSAIMLEISAELSIELGRIMQKHWEEQQIFRSSQDLTSLDPSMKRSASSGSMKRVASGNTLYSSQAQQQQQSMKRVASGNSIHSIAKLSNGSLASMANLEHQKANEDGKQNVAMNDVVDDNTFTQRLLRGVATILRSRLLMTIFTYNALFSSINTLLSFQRAELVANRKKSFTVSSDTLQYANKKKDTTVSADTAFLANINFVSSIAMFAMQSSGAGALIAKMFGTRGSLALMPLIRLGGLLCLCWWHRSTDGQPPNLALFLMLDEFTKVINQAVAKPVRESLWSDTDNEARYEAKPIIDVLANRWGAGSASFCVDVVSRVLLFLGQTHLDNDNATTPVVLGLPPVLFLGLIVSAWWVGVSLDLGQLRARIDLELKKHR